MTICSVICWTPPLSPDRRCLNQKRPAIKLKKPVFNIRRIVMFVLFLLICIGLYLLALNSYCDQGGNFELGVCAITSFIPF
ncbi:PhoP/PhoQ regulator MgrB [Rahnella sp. AA]|uniref:PhoP/PhoQ regulator MgrB n=1 Tax=Rahnella sp. AA TaxID=2057180 RepID=UPI0035116B9A